MRAGRLTLFAIALAAPALAAAGLNLDELAGVYKYQFDNGLVDGTKFRSEDVLEIVKLSPDKAYIRADLQFYNGHTCTISGIAHVEGDKLVYRAKDADMKGCVLTLSRKGKQIVFGDETGACKEVTCGVRGSYDGDGFDVASRRPIRYMKRLLASRQFADAQKEEQLAR